MLLIQDFSCHALIFRSSNQLKEQSDSFLNMGLHLKTDSISREKHLWKKTSHPQLDQSLFSLDVNMLLFALMQSINTSKNDFSMLTLSIEKLSPGNEQI